MGTRSGRVRIVRLLAVTLSAAVLATACEPDSPRSTPARSPQTTPEKPNSRLIGLVATMSGDDSWRGQSAFEGADLGVHKLNRRLAEDEEPFELVVRDDQGDPERAVKLIRELAEIERVRGIVFAGPPEALPETEPSLAEAGIPALLVYGDLYGARLLRPHLFQASPSLLWESRRIASYLVRDRGYRRIGLMASLSLDGTSAVRSLRAAVRPMPGTRVIDHLYGSELEARDASDAELSQTLQRFERQRVQAVVVESQPRVFGRVVAELRSMGALYRDTRTARRSATRGRPWRPQIVGYDMAISPRPAPDLPPGTVASDSYARGVHLLPLPGFRAFKDAFEGWWDSEPLGWQQRAYDGVSMIGWAARRTGRAGDVARTLERVRSLRFGGLDVTLGPDDHTSVDQTSVGLWTVPAPSAELRGVRALPEELPWVPLARGFSINGRRTDISSYDWRYLFRDPPPRVAPAPSPRKMKFAVATPSKDPIH